MARRSMREEISAAALEKFHTCGYNAAGVKDITDAAGVPKGSFYNHFDSKEAMAIEALRRYDAGGRLSNLADESLPPLPRLRAHFEAQRDDVVRYGYKRGCMLGNFGGEIADHSEPIRTAVAGSFERWSGLIAAAIAQAQQDEAVAASLDPATTARFILSAWEGALIYARVERAPGPFEAFFTTVFDVLLVSGA
jgi:TetR/AcrR family transcriptional regulator, transcriptional repressor for nem operon